MARLDWMPRLEGGAREELTPHPKGMPKAIGIAQWMVVGTQVQENTSWPIGVRTAPIHMMLADASGATRPVSGSLSCELIIFLQTGSMNIAISVPIPIPTKDRPVCPGPHPRCCWNTMGYATKHFWRLVSTHRDVTC